MPYETRRAYDATAETRQIPANDQTHADALMKLQPGADYLDCSIRTLRRKISSGELPAYRVGDSPMLRVRKSDLDALLRPIPNAGS